MPLGLGIRVGSAIKVGQNTIECISVGGGKVVIRRPDGSTVVIDEGNLKEVLPHVRIGVTARPRGGQAHIAIAAPEDMLVLRLRTSR